MTGAAFNSRTHQLADRLIRLEEICSQRIAEEARPFQTPEGHRRAQARSVRAAGTFNATERLLAAHLSVPVRDLAR